ncbi:MAG: AAA family ATPase [Acidobacteria bacterium]|nr:AAA family ATPase [Acidobacteriota bacterium]
MNRRRLPIGIQNFREIREEGHYYVDKTAFARRLAEEGKHYFLSRPRRFGKSLFLDTLKELFEGNEPLFRGLAIHGAWDWSARHPVVRFSFGSGGFRDPDSVRASVSEQLARAERRAGLDPHYETTSGRLGALVEALAEQSGHRVVVLVDEYDKPILDALGTPEVARANRDFLRGLYGAVKEFDAHIRMSFFTGVSKFTKVSVFSELNNLIDLTLERPYGAICGYREADLDSVFAPELPGLDRELIREWYDGYNWRGERMYNPFDILLLFRKREFKAHWFETGSPAFLIQKMLERRVLSVDLEAMHGEDELLSEFDVDEMATEALLFQTGYLTITGEEDLGGEPHYRLGYPNREVRQGLNRRLLGAMAPAESRRLLPSLRLRGALEASDFDAVEGLFRAFFAGIPYEWHTRNPIARYEGYYASVFYSHFAAAGLDVRVDDSSSRGRVDMAVRFEGSVFLFEFKVVEEKPEGTALRQLRARGYADKYRHLRQPIHLVGVEFGRAARNIVAFEVEAA